MTSAPATSSPQVIYLAPSRLVPGGAPQQPQTTAPQTGAGQAAPTGAPQTSAPSQGSISQPSSEATGQARSGASLLSRVMGLIPIGTGVVQSAVGMLITRGTISLVGIPVLGSLPPFIVGGLVAATAMPSIVRGIGKLLGKI